MMRCVDHSRILGISGIYHLLWQRSQSCSCVPVVDGDLESPTHPGHTHTHTHTHTCTHTHTHTHVSEVGTLEHDNDNMTAHSGCDSAVRTVVFVLSLVRLAGAGATVATVNFTAVLLTLLMLVNGCCWCSHVWRIDKSALTPPLHTHTHTHFFLTWVKLSCNHHPRSKEGLCGSTAAMSGFFMMQSFFYSLSSFHTSHWSSMGSIGVPARNFVPKWNSSHRRMAPPPLSLLNQAIANLWQHKSGEKPNVDVA